MLEALIGAIYLDLGNKKCKEFIFKVFDLENEVVKMIEPGGNNLISNPQQAIQRIEERIKNHIISTLNSGNSISALQEFLAQKGESPPEYTEIGRTGTSHQPVFTLEANCRFQGRCLVAEGKGSSIKEARKNAAHSLLVKVVELYKTSWSNLQ